MCGSGLACGTSGASGPSRGSISAVTRCGIARAGSAHSSRAPHHEIGRAVRSARLLERWKKIVNADSGKKIASPV